MPRGKRTTPICSAHSKQTGLPCKQPVVPGMKVCHYHGGKSLKGIANPAFKHGGYSEFLPESMISTYETLLADTEILNLKSEIALVKTFIIEALGGLHNGNSARIWEDLRKIWDHLSALRRKPQTEETSALIVQAFNDVGDLINRGSQPYMVRDEVMRLEETLRKLGETEQKRLERMQAMISSERATLIFSGILDSIRRNVTDRKQRDAIASDIRTLATIGG